MIIVPSLKFPLRRPKIYLFISIITRITIYFHFLHHTFLFTFAFQWALNLIPTITFSNHLIFLISYIHTYIHIYIYIYIRVCVSECVYPALHHFSICQCRLYAIYVKRYVNHERYLRHNKRTRNFVLLNIHCWFNIANIILHSTDDGSLEPKRYRVDFASQ